MSQRFGFRGWFWILLVLSFSHALSCLLYLRQFNQTKPLGLTLETPVEDWASTLEAWPSGIDPAAYLFTALNFSKGKGLIDHRPIAGIQKKFVYWAPGTPFVLGALLWITGAKTLKPYFFFIAATEWLVGLALILCGALYFQQLGPLLFLAVFSAFLFPIKDFYYGPYLTMSEPLAAIPFAYAGLFLCRGFLGFAARTAYNRSFLFAGVLLGLASLFRDSMMGYGVFLTAMVTVLCFRRSKRLVLSLALGSSILLGANSVRLPVKWWNWNRVGKQMVSASGSNAIWREGLWTLKPLSQKEQDMGLGFGSYLDPQKGKAMLQAYAHGQGSSLKSVASLVSVVLQKPVRALQYKQARMPVLWLGVEDLSKFHLGFIQWFALIGYALGLAYLLVPHSGPKPEILWLYPAFLLLSTPIIHFEFRYSFLAWFALPLAWVLLVTEILGVLAGLSRKGSRLAAVLK